MESLKLVEFINENFKKVSIKVIKDQNGDKTARILANNKVKKLFNRAVRGEVSVKKIQKKFDLGEVNIGDTIEISVKKIMKMAA